jgi:hypothetical protein
MSLLDTHPPNEQQCVGGPVMHPEMEMLRCAIVRGGTRKGVFIMMNEYPKDPGCHGWLARAARYESFSPVR